MQSNRVIADVMRHRDALFAVILAMVRNFDAAEDIMQETMVEIMRQSNGYDPQKALLPWAKGVARNMARRYWQSRDRSIFSLNDRDHLEYLADIIERQPEPDWQEERKALHLCLRSLGSKNRSLLEYRYVKGLQGTRLAEISGLALSSLANTYARLRRKLRDCVRQRMQEMSS